MYVDQVILEFCKGVKLALNAEQVEALRHTIASYGLAAVMDSSIRKEAEKVCQELADKDGL